MGQVFHSAVTVWPAATVAVISVWWWCQTVRACAGTRARTGGSLLLPMEHVMSPEVTSAMYPESGFVARTMREGCGVV